MRLSQILVAFVVAIAIARDSSASGAERFVGAPAQSFYLDLDTTDGHFSSWRHDDVAAFSALRATVTATRLGFNLRWKPVLGIWLQASKSQPSLGLQFWRPSWIAPLSIRLVRSDRGQLTELKSFHKTLDVDEVVDVTITWTPRSAVFTVGDETSALSGVRWPVRSIEVTASTGDFHLDRFQFGSHEH